MSGLFCSSARTVISTGSRWYTQEMSITSPGNGGGKEAQVPPLGHQVQDAGHVPDEAHVQHPVGLVQHHRLHLVQADGAALHVVHQAAGGGHHDLGAASLIA